MCWTYWITIRHLSKSRCAPLLADWNVAVVVAGSVEWKRRLMSGMFRLLRPFKTAIVPPWSGLAVSPHMLILIDL